MPALTTAMPTLKLLSSAASHPPSLPAERAVNRQVLIDIAPDREGFFAKTKSIGEIRQALKLRSGCNHG
jgi:hypothetical protein